MLDVFNIQGQQDNLKIFYVSDSTSNGWQTWQKPRGCKYIWIMCIGGAAGGGAGQGTVTTTGTQGSGGGSAAITRALFQANVLPDTLYIQPGLGGTGATGTAAGPVASGLGNRSFVSIVASSTVAMNLVCASGTIVASATTAETVATQTSVGLLGLGIFTVTAGKDGTTGAASALNNSIITAGSGGGGVAASVASAGSSISSIDNITFVTPTITGGAATGVAGTPGMWFWKPFYGLGGAGGGANLSGVGGAGGNGSYGCGGGGGGCGSTNGGNGGKGGDGLVVIITF
jgi:hypothetical protein